jgi:NAD(P)-dependent dehydrogenase (short-subunit alcohol dehydrogenase family)
MNAAKTVLITGASSGIGLETALYFFEQGWNVIATMRHPEQRRTALHEKGLPHLVHLDVMDKESIQAAIRYALDTCGVIDVLVNNAGYAVYGPFECTTQAQIQRQFDTNLFGLMEVARQFLPVFRRQKFGTMVNVSSMGGRVGFPLYSAYNSTKFAVEGFTEALQYELRPLGIRVKLVEPGVIKTDFYDRSLDCTDNSALGGAYDGVLKRSQKFQGESAIRKGSEPRLVAHTIYRAATVTSGRIRFPAGVDAQQVKILRWLLPERWFYRVLEKFIMD